MAIDLKAVAVEKIRRWQNLMELAEDPEFEPYLNLKGINNSHSRKPVVIAAKQSSASSSNNGATRPKAYVVNAVGAALTRVANEFTTGDLDRQLKTAGFEFRAKNVNIAINDALRTLQKRNLVEPTRKRKGFQRIWRKTPVSHSSAAESRTA